LKILATLTNLSLTLGGKKLFDKAQVTINQGERIGLLGLNGHGKSSLLKIIIEEIKADTTIPTFMFDKTRDFCRPDGKLDVLLIPQEIDMRRFGRIPIIDFFWSFYPELHEIHLALEDINKKLESDYTNETYLALQQEYQLKLDDADAWNLQQRYESYLKSLELLNFQQEIHELSGGEQKKVLLSLGLAAPHALILWDEPTNHLDLETLDFLESELKSSSKTFIVISHDRTFLAKVTNKIVSIQHHKLHPFQGSYAEYLEHLATQEQERQALLAKLKNTLKRETEWMRQGIRARGTRSKKRVENYVDLKSKVSTIKEQAKRLLDMNMTASTRKTKILVNAKNVSFSYPEQGPLFQNLNVELWKEDRVGLIGPNGVGKSTLLKLLMGELSPVSGTIKRADDLNVAYFSQHREELTPNLTPATYLCDGNDMVHLANGSVLHINGYLERFLFQRADAHRPLSHFSGGEKNRLQLAKHLLKKADLWIFDEPTNDLDLETLEILERTLCESRGALILISHDRSFLSQVTNKVWYLTADGFESFHGGYSQVEEYIATLQLEREINQLGDEAPKTKNSQKTQKPKRVIDKEQLSKDIATFEQIISKITESLQKIEEEGDFTGEKTQVYGELQARLGDLEEKLLRLYEDLES
jgi:ABC transport system ATP-binding/permease protein